MIWDNYHNVLLFNNGVVKNLCILKLMPAHKKKKFQTIQKYRQPHPLKGSFIIYLSILLEKRFIYILYFIINGSIICFLL